MLTLLSEAKFWTCRNEINIKDNDFGAYKYNTKSLKSDSVHRDGKENYTIRRGSKWNIDNKSPVKLKKCVKQLEDELREHKIVFCQWKDNCILQLMLSNGLLIHICINVFTGDILKVAFDKYFIGKLVSEIVVDVIITRMHIIISYNENQVTFVYLQKPNMKRNAPEKINRMDPKIFNIIIGGPHGRKLGRYLSCNNSFDLLVIWTKSSQNEVYPWRPTVRDQDRANIHVYKFSRTKLELLCYHWTEYDPICVEFSKLNHNQFKSVEQKISKKGDVTIENCTYEINNSIIQRVSVTSIPLQTQVCCHAISPDYEKLMLGCIDGSVLLFDESRGITHHVKAAFIPTLISWHCDSALVLIANERCQLQCFDISLSCVKHQLISEDMTPANVLDLSGYFAYQPTMSKICWSKKSDLVLNNEKYVQTDAFLFMLYDNGPISCLRVFGGSGLKGDIHTSGFTADVIVSKYLLLHHVEKAINILLCLNWDTYGAMCLISLHKIANYIFNQPLSVDREIQIQKALGSFHIPVKQLCIETETEFGDQVRDITRKFFFYLLRFKSYEKAFSLAIDINDVDLFMDLYNTSKSDGLNDISIDSFRKAEEIYVRADSVESEHSICSRSSCSICTGSIHSESEVEEDSKEIEKSSQSADEKISEKHLQSLVPPLPTCLSPNSNNYIPPLPYFTNSLKVPNIPKPELRVGTNNSKLKVKSHSSLSIWSPQSGMQQSSTISNRNMYYDNILPIETSSSQASKRNLIKINNKNNLSSMQYHSQSSSSLMPSHVVLDVIPKPKLNRNVQATISINKDRDWSNNIHPQPDQTIGIPLTNINMHHKVLTNTLSNHFPNKQPLLTRLASTNIYPSHFTPISNSYTNNISAYNNINVYNNNSTMIPPLPPLPPPPVIHQYPLISGNIPQITTSKSYNSTEYLNKTNNSTHNRSSTNHYSNIPGSGINTSSILANTSSINISSHQNSNLKKETGEKNKVKFSDTITVAVVPEIPRKERLKRSNGMNSRMTDPKRELADSLPLCHPNDEYLKDFTPMAEISPNEDNNAEESRNSNSIKVIHFGVV